MPLKPDLDTLLRAFLEEKPWAEMSAELNAKLEDLRTAFDEHEKKDDKRSANLTIMIETLARRTDRLEHHAEANRIAPTDLAKWVTDTGSFHVPGHDMDAILRSYEDKAAAARWRTTLGFLGKVLLAVVTVAAIGAAGYAWRVVSTPPMTQGAVR